jgi:hypothetical protein
MIGSIGNAYLFWKPMRDSHRIKSVPKRRFYNDAVFDANPHWARVVGYGPFSLCVIHKEGLCPSCGDIKRLMVVVVYLLPIYWMTIE